MDGLGLESYTYGYSGYACAYTAGEYWSGYVNDENTDPHSRRSESLDPLFLAAPRSVARN